MLFSVLHSECGADMLVCFERYAPTISCTMQSCLFRNFSSSDALFVMKNIESLICDKVTFHVICVLRCSVGRAGVRAAAGSVQESDAAKHRRLRAAIDGDLRRAGRHRRSPLAANAMTSRACTIESRRSRDRKLRTALYLWIIVPHDVTHLLRAV